MREISYDGSEDNEHKAVSNNKEDHIWKDIVLTNVGLSILMLGDYNMFYFLKYLILN